MGVSKDYVLDRLKVSQYESSGAIIQDTPSAKHSFAGHPPVPHLTPRHPDANCLPPRIFLQKEPHSAAPCPCMFHRHQLHRRSVKIPSIKSGVIRFHATLNSLVELTTRFLKREPSVCDPRSQPRIQAKHLIHAHPHLGAKCKVGRATGLLIIPRQSLKRSMVHPLASK